MRKLGWLVLAVAWSVYASATVNPGAISGTVRDSGGVPQMGALVEIISNAAAGTQSALTDAKGYFRVGGLLPGTYLVRVTAPSFMPSVRDRVGLQSGASVMVNVTLNTLFEALQWAPKHQSSASDKDDWQWTLRSMSNRPILRAVDERKQDHANGPDLESHENDITGTLSFITGNDGEAFGGSGMNTTFRVEQSLFGKGKWALNGGLGYGPAEPNAVLRASYTHEMADGSSPEIAISAKRFSSVDPNQEPLQAAAVTVSNTTVIADALQISYGAETQMVQYKQRSTAFRPFGSASLHLGPNTIVQYRYATSVPNLRKAKGFDTDPADLSESGPRVSLVKGSAKIEDARHQEVSVSQRMGKNSVQLAVYNDSIENATLNGAGADLPYNGELLMDPYSGTFAYNGGTFQTTGSRIVFQRKLVGDMSGTIDYAFGGVLAAPEDLRSIGQLNDRLITRKQHAIAAKISGTTPVTKTKLIGSYRWLSSSGALTPVDMFNTSPGQTDPYLSFFVRQPIPSSRFLPNGLEALIDIRNLLAQGYQPVIGPDGSTVYLVQMARSVRAGLSFTF